MKAINKISGIFLLGIILLLTACETDLEIPLPEHESKLVINAYLEAGKPFEVYLSRSYGILENAKIDDILVKNATVEILENSQVIATLQYRDTVIQNDWNPGVTYTLAKYYSPDMMVEAGKTYTVRASHTDYETASGTATIPSAPDVKAMEIEQDVYVYQYTDFNGETYGHGQSMLRVTINDPGNQTNFYDFDLWLEFEDPYGSGEIIKDMAYLRNNVYRDPEGGFSGDNKPIPDTDINGTAGKVEVLADLPYNSGLVSERKPLKIVKAYLTAKSLSEEYALFKEKFELQQQNNDSDDFGIIPSESIVAYTNVEGGYGIVAGFNEKLFEF